MPSRYLSRQIGKYRVIRFLGGGAFAWVYEAVDRDLEIPVALKILRPEFAGQADAEVRFRREATMAARLRHPNIVTVRDVGQVDGASFVAMDLLPLSLARRLELLPRLPEAEVVRIGLDVAAALAIAHAGGIVHRDIKPDNILIGPNGEAVVADFGLARALDGGAGLSGSNQVMGTPHYFSPEQARGLELDGRTDLYALGVTLFRAVTGRLPFEGDDWYAVARMHVETTPPTVRSLIPDVSEGFDAIIDRLLKKNPNERFGSALELADALAGLTTAPVSRTMSTMRSGASETITAFSPPVVAVQRSRSSHLVRQFTAVAAVIAVVAWIASQSSAVQSLLQNASPPPALAPTPDTTLAVTDTTARSTSDTATTPLRIDSVKPKTPATAALDDSMRRLAAERVRTTLLFSAPDSATLFVDGNNVGRGTQTITRPSAARLLLRAFIQEAPEGCPTAQMDSVVRLGVGEKRAVTLPVRTCMTVRFKASQPDAIVTFTPRAGGSPVAVHVDTATSVLLPVGTYEIKASAQRCIEYRDSVMVRRGATDTDLSRSIRFICGGG